MNRENIRESIENIERENLQLMQNLSHYVQNIINRSNPSATQEEYSEFFNRLGVIYANMHSINRLLNRIRNQSQERPSSAPVPCLLQMNIRKN